MMLTARKLRCQERWRTLRFDSFHLRFLKYLPRPTQGTSKENQTLNLHCVFKDVEILPGFTLDCFLFSNSSIREIDYAYYKSKRQ